MEIEKEGDVRVPLAFAVFFLCVTTGGVFLFLYVFVPSLSQPWYQSAALFLIAAPWIFWLLTFLYTIMKRCCGARPRPQQTTRSPGAPPPPPVAPPKFH